MCPEQGLAECSCPGRELTRSTTRVQDWRTHRVGMGRRAATFIHPPVSPRSLRQALASHGPATPLRRWVGVLARSQILSCCNGGSECDRNRQRPTPAPFWVSTLSAPPVCAYSCRGFGWEKFVVRIAASSLLCVGHSVIRVSLAVHGRSEPRMVAARNNTLHPTRSQRVRVHCVTHRPILSSQFRKLAASSPLPQLAASRRWWNSSSRRRGVVVTQRRACGLREHHEAVGVRDVSGPAAASAFFLGLVLYSCWPHPSPPMLGSACICSILKIWFLPRILNSWPLVHSRSFCASSSAPLFVCVDVLPPCPFALESRLVYEAIGCEERAVL